MNAEPRLPPPLYDELKRAFDALGQRKILRGEIIAADNHAKPPQEPDAWLDLRVGRALHRFAVTTRARIDRATALNLIHEQLKTLPEPHLLFTPYLTAALAAHCRELDLPFIDAAGNAYLRAPGLYIFIKGEKPQPGTAGEVRPPPGGTATELRVVFALLQKPALQFAPYRKIANTAGVALGAVGRVIDGLAARGHMAIGKKRRRLLDPPRLFDEWVTNYPMRLRPKLHPRRFQAATDDWWKHARLAEINACWGGEIAADRLTNYLKPAQCTIYLDPATGREGMNRLVAAHHLRGDQKGNIEVLNAFWTPLTDQLQPEIAPPMLVYADLVATLDPRLLDVARKIRKQYIDDALHQI